MAITRLGAAIATNTAGTTLAADHQGGMIWRYANSIFRIGAGGDQVTLTTGITGATVIGETTILSDGRILLTATEHSGLGAGNIFEIRNADGTSSVAAQRMTDFNGVRGGADATALRNGGFFVTYDDVDNGGTPIQHGNQSGSVTRASDVTWRTFGADGTGGASTIIWQGPNDLPGVTVDRVGFEQSSADSVQLTNGSIVTAYRDQRAFGTPGGGYSTAWAISVQIGTPGGGFSAPFQANMDVFDTTPYGPGDLDHPVQPESFNSIVALPDGGFAVIWHERIYTPANPIGNGYEGHSSKIRYFNADGSARTGEIEIAYRDNEHGNHSLQIRTDVLPDGRVVIAYNSGIGGVNGNGELDAYLSVLGVNGGVQETLTISPPTGNGDFFHISDMAVRTDGTIDVAYFNDVPQYVNGVFQPGTQQTIIQRFAVSGLGYTPISGTAATETLTGSATGDLVYADAGDDTVNGLAGEDFLYGGAGNDVLNGGDGNDTLAGGAGTDTLAGGAGTDTAIFAGARSSYTITSTGAGAYTVTGPDGTDTLTGVELARFADRTYLLSDLDAMIGGASNDTLYGTAAADRIYGLTGNDTIFGGDGSDTLNGDEGNDILVGNTQVFVAQADTLNGGDGDDILYGEAADTLNGGAGRDSLIAINSYNFNLNMTASSIEYAIMDFGNDVITALGQTVRVDVFASGGNDHVTGSNFDDALFGGAGNDTIIGGLGNDAIVGEAGADSLNGGDGDDRIYMDAQDSFVSGGAGYDAAYITAGSGGGATVNLGASSFEFIQDLAGLNDTLLGSTATAAFTAYAGGGGDTVDGSAFADTVWGEAGDDVISGNGGADVLVGGAGLDRINGGAGNDALYGGAADGVRDTFVFQHTGVANADAIYDFVIGQDKLDLSTFGASFAGVSITTAGGSSIVYLNGQLVCTVVGVTGLTATDFLMSASPSPAEPDDGIKGDTALVQPTTDYGLDEAWVQPAEMDDGPSIGDAAQMDLAWLARDHGRLSDGWLTVLV